MEPRLEEIYQELLDGKIKFLCDMREKKCCWPQNWIDVVPLIKI
jgi:hypothetical protein